MTWARTNDKDNKNYGGVNDNKAPLHSSFLSYSATAVYKRTCRTMVNTVIRTKITRTTQGRCERKPHGVTSLLLLFLSDDKVEDRK